MPDQPDETQKQQRRSSALPPFFAPRTAPGRPTTPSQPGTAAPQRRSSQLFTPPGVQKLRPVTLPAIPLATPIATPIATPVFEPAAPPPVPFEMDPPASAPTATFDAPPDLPNEEPARDPAPEAPAAPPSGDAFVIEQFEQAPISLRATGDHAAVQDESTLSFQVYDDASRLVERGERPAPPTDSDSIEIERTEVTFEPPTGESRLEVESFWAAETIQPRDTPRDAAAAPLGVEPAAAGPREQAAPEPPSVDRTTQPILDAVEQAPDAMPVPSWLEPAPSEPAPVAEAAPEVAPEPAAPDDADEALAEAFSEPAPNETVPRWATPRASRAVSDDDRPTQPNDGWNFAPPAPPPDELAVALAWPDSGLRAPTPAQGVAAQGGGDTSHELAASAEGWPLSVAGRPGVPDAVAAALERIAQRVRAGEVPLPADVALAKSDESALALALAALLRAAASPRA